jgi:ligand-binding sensor domain-containing protein
VKKHHLIKLFFLLITHAFLFEGLAQNYVITNYSTKDGLPSNLTYQICKDADGFIWVATSNGLARFDGTNFEIYGPREGIYGNEVISVFPLNEGILGYYLNGCFVKSKNGFINLRKNELSNLDFGDHLYTEVIDSYLVVSSRHYVYVFNKNTLSLKSREVLYKSIPYKKPDGSIGAMSIFPYFKHQIKDFDIDEIVRVEPKQNKSNEILIFSPSRGWIYTFDRLTTKVNQLYNANRSIIRAYRSIDSTLYICSSNGLSVVNRQNNKEHQIIKDVIINYVYEDNEGTLWVCSATSGIYKVTRSKHLVAKKTFQSSFPYIQTLAKLPSGEIISGNKDGSYTSLNTLKTTYFESKPSINRVTSICTYNTNVLFFTDNFIANQRGERIASLGCSKKASFYAQDTILTSNCESTFFYLLSQNKLEVLMYGRATTHLLTRDKAIYIGTPTALVFKKNLADTFQSIALENNNPTKINCIVEDNKGRTWVCTDGWGLFLLSKQHEILEKFNKKNGLESDNVITLSIDENDRIWIGTDKGLFLIKEEKNGVFEVIKPFSDLDLQNNEVKTIATKKDTVFFATGNEFMGCRYNDQFDVRKITVNISSLLINDSSISLQQTKFAPYQNRIKISLECPLTNSGEKPLFLYALIKSTQKDTLWQKTQNATLEFNSLSPDEYTLLISAKDPGIAYSKSNTLVWHFTITEFFYKTWWFYTLVLFAIFSIIFAVYFFYNKQRQNRIQKELEADAKINELKLQGLLSQMNPHFLFNSLNVIQKFITSNDDINALTHLSDFSDLMRESLDQTRRGHISLEDEFLFLEQYVNLEKKRFDNDFIFHIHNEIEDDLSDIIIPPMLIQPLVENAIKHGVANMKSPQGEIHVTFSLLHHSLLQVCIRDNGNQRSSSRKDQKKKESHALNIIQERVELIKHGDFSGKFDIKIDEVGATAILNIPIV